MSGTHTVAQGETLPEIAQRNNLTLGQLVAANPDLCPQSGATPSASPGQTLAIPPPTFSTQVDSQTGVSLCPLNNPNFVGVLLWPSWRFPQPETPAAQISQTGTLVDHWHYVPGVLNLNVSPPNWSQAERFTEASYSHDVLHAGDPLPHIQVDVFRAGAGGDLDDHATLSGQVPLVSSFSDGAGRFQFNLEPGDYVLSLKGRFSFIQNDFQGGVLPSPPQSRHNGVQVDALQNLEGRHRLHLLMTVTAQQVTFTSAGGGAFAVERLLASGQTAADIVRTTPYRFCVLPLAIRSNSSQWEACTESLRRAFNVQPAQVQALLRRTPVLDMDALHRWPIEGAASAPSGADAGNDLLKRTLLLSGQENTVRRSAAYDHAYWSFATAEATTRSRGRFVPLGSQGIFLGDNPLYGLASKTKDTYGRYALRMTAPLLEGRDIRELKIRLILWGSDTQWVDLRNDRFDQALRDALIRFKANRQLFRRKLLNAQNGSDYARSTITALVDDETYAMLDSELPSLNLDSVADSDDPLQQGTALLTDQGYSRLLFYAAEISRRRIAPERNIHVHSSFRTVAHNRRVYLGLNRLHWRLANSAPVATFEQSGFTTQVGGVMGANNTAHVAGASVTAATVRYREPRGTYVGGSGDYWAPDYSRHTTGRALDYCMRHPGHVVEAVQRDTDALKLFGAVRSTHADGRLWLEPRKVNASSAAGTTTWIHMDTGDIPMAKEEFVLTDEDARGPRWDANLILRGRVLQQGSARLGTRVRLHQGDQILATTYTDLEGRFSLRVRQGQVTGSYTVRASYNPQYPYQPPPEVAAQDLEAPAQSVTFTYAGEEIILGDITLPEPVANNPAGQ
ncbi:hypothetical protein CYFUS_006489 [Cystobacter fuscus]|uniref:LysM domain-containing protein n=1 Tax=Cystobacter fuscus TaxID=43 RepID=A0A250JBX9_9BACT|nr:LysM domain-containing protein [Cystobacter fuscus]ATB41027.1 hypothetical protein CYFUS_006489 [Cystobacter fuscus]